MKKKKEIEEGKWFKCHFKRCITSVFIKNFRVIEAGKQAGKMSECLLNCEKS